MYRAGFKDRPAQLAGQHIVNNSGKRNPILVVKLLLNSMIIKLLPIFDCKLSGQGSVTVIGHLTACTKLCGWLCVGFFCCFVFFLRVFAKQ